MAALTSPPRPELLILRSAGCHRRAVGAGRAWPPGCASYYRHSRAIYRAATRDLESQEALTQLLLAQFRDWRSRLGNADFSVHRERAHFREPQLLDARPGSGAAAVRIRCAPRLSPVHSNRGAYRSATGSPRRAFRRRPSLLARARRHLSAFRTRLWLCAACTIPARSSRFSRS